MTKLESRHVRHIIKGFEREQVITTLNCELTQHILINQLGFNEGLIHIEQESCVVLLLGVDSIHE